MIRSGSMRHPSATLRRLSTGDDHARRRAARDSRRFVDFRSATPALPIAIGRPASAHPRSLAEQAPNSPRQRTASAEIPIATDARPHHISRGFLPWRFAYAGPVSAAPPHGAAIRKPSH